jgi:hypothetical protein
MRPNLECHCIRRDVYEEVGSKTEGRRDDEVHIDLVQISLKVDYTEREAREDVYRVAEGPDFGFATRINVTERVVPRICIEISWSGKRILADKPLQLGMVVARPTVIFIVPLDKRWDRRTAIAGSVCQHHP